MADNVLAVVLDERHTQAMKRIAKTLGMKRTDAIRLLIRETAKQLEQQAIEEKLTGAASGRTR